MRVDEFLSKLHGVKQSGEGWVAKCPAHDDRQASLTVAEGDDGKILVRCHAGDGCSFEAICTKLGLTPRDLFAAKGSNGRRIVATYDYEDEQSVLLFQAVRFEPKDFLQRRPDGRGGWVWKLEKTRRVLYRLPRVLDAVKAGSTVYVVEGEKDVHALEAAGVVATCNPMGAGKWRDSYAKTLRGADVVIVQDLDDKGREHARKVAASLAGMAKTVLVVEAAEGKDAADHLDAGLTIADFRPVEPEDPEKPNPASEGAALREKAFRPADLTPPGKPPLADEPDILSVFVKDIERAGLAGEQQAAKITYLALTSRLLPWGKPTNRPVSAIAKGTTSTGKSYTQRTVLRFFPAEAYFDLGSMSKKYLLYTDESLEHRFIVVAEWASIAGDDEIVASLRTLLSEGHLVHGTVDGDGKRQARKIEKDGPTGLLMTTTAATTDVELETRCLAFLTDDTPDQTKRVFETLARLEDKDDLDVDFDRWHDLQRWIAEAGEHRVVIPFARELARLMPTTATRLRRDFVSMLCLVRAHAILHQATRERDDRDRIVATIGDYKAVNELMDALVAEAVEANVSPATRQTVHAVRDLLERKKTEHVSIKAIQNELGIGKSATYDRVKRAAVAGFLVNKTKEGERGWKVALGADLPDSGTFLPIPEDVFQAYSDRAPGNGNGSTEHDPGDLSGFPDLPADDELPPLEESQFFDPDEAAETAHGDVIEAAA